MDDIRDGSNSSNPEDLTVFDGILYFSADDGTNGHELWKYDPNDGPGGTTSLVDDIRDGSDSSDPDELTVYDGALYFHARDGITGEELWKYDSLTEMTSQVADINLGPNSSYPHDLVVFDGELYFAAEDGSAGNEIWSYGGTDMGIVSDINKVLNDTIDAISSSGNYLFVQAETQEFGDELWVYNPDGWL